MKCMFFEVSIVKRSMGQSAVDAAAYQSRSSIFCEYDQRIKNHTRKGGLLHEEVLLPVNAPREYANRDILWNSAESVEKQWNSQLARRLIFDIPREIPPEMCPGMIREYCEEYFVSRGMCCDFAIHDPEPAGHHRHCHVLLTLRAIDENGNWLPKRHKVQIPDEYGQLKEYYTYVVDWNDRNNCEVWRHGWETVANHYLEMAGSSLRLDMRSYERQGLDILPQLDMGNAIRLERKGIQTRVGNMNREIIAFNEQMEKTNSRILELSEQMRDLTEKKNQIIEKTGENLSLSVEREQEVLEEMKETKERMEDLSEIRQAASVFRIHRQVYDTFSGIRFTPSRAAYYSRHRMEIEACNRALLTLKKLDAGENTDGKAIQKEYDSLHAHLEQLSTELSDLRETMPLMRALLSQERERGRDRTSLREQLQLPPVQKPREKTPERKLEMEL